MFPPYSAANRLRGWFGLTLRRKLPEIYLQIFAPGAAEPGPSGLATPPRPFVFRASHLDGCTFEAGERFWLGVNAFDDSGAIQAFQSAFAVLADEGLAPRRSRADLIEMNQDAIAIPLDAVAPARFLRIEFRTPTDLKNDGVPLSQPDFGVLFSRARDRISALSALYGDGPAAIDHRALGGRARSVQMTRCDLRRLAVQRRSSRTGQVHSIGGFVGVAEYAGDLGEFLPYLEAAGYTGVGRHAVWGNGEIAPSILPEKF